MICLIHLKRWMNIRRNEKMSKVKRPIVGKNICSLGLNWKVSNIKEIWGIKNEMRPRPKSPQDFWAEGFPVVQKVKRLPAMPETWVQSPGWEDPLEKEMTTHSSTLDWKIPWIGEPSKLQSMGSQSLTRLSNFTTKSEGFSCKLNIGDLKISPWHIHILYFIKNIL